MGKPAAARKFQVQKSAALGLLVPQSLRLEVRELDAKDNDIGLVFETTSLAWWECMVTLPPKFLLLSAGKNVRNSITTQDPSSVKEDVHELNAAIAKVTRPLMNLPPRSKATIEMGHVSECFKNDSVEGGLPYDTHPAWHVQQNSFKREYRIQPTDVYPTTPGEAVHESADSSGTSFVWRGSHGVLASLPESSRKRAECHGNLKLLGPNDQLLAAWQQQRDKKVLGYLYIFDDATELIPMEVVVISCLYVVLVERILWTTFVGG